MDLLEDTVDEHKPWLSGYPEIYYEIDGKPFYATPQGDTWFSVNGVWQKAYRPPFLDYSYGC